MARDERARILDRLQTELGAPILAYVTGDRPNLATQIAAEQIILFPRHLKAIGEQKRAGLLIYTRGGDTNSAWPIINFVRAYFDEVFVLVPFFAHSAGTLICLGADQIYMSKLATLSPIDPSVANAFNPQDPTNAQNRIPIAVEDVMAYFELAKAQGVKRDLDVAAAFTRLAESVHPLALGNVHRSIEQIRQLADKLIRLHSPDAAREDVEERIRRLTTAFYTHAHLINRPEAHSLGLPVETPSDKIEELMLDYYQTLVHDLELTTKFDPSKFVAATQSGASAPATHRFERAYVETSETCDVYITEGAITMQPQQMPMQLPPGVQAPTLPPVATFEITKDDWEQVA